MIPTRIYGLIGYPVRHSFSPALYNAAFQALKINAEYRLFEVKPEKLEDFLLKNIEIEDTKGQTFYSQKIQGFNITIPHKVKALELAFLVEDNITVHYPDVVLAGAINTVKRDKGKLRYRNTDTVGFMKSLQEDLKFDTKDKNILIFGCGGAGRALIAGLTCEGTNVKKIYIYDTSKKAIDSAKKHFDRFDSVKDKLEYVQEKERIPDMIKKCQLLVNASPVGMKEGDGSVVDKKLLHQGLSVYDVVYNRKTQLIKDAGSLEPPLPAKDGLGMLLYQGAAAFEFWTGQKAPIEIMRQALQKELKKCKG